MPTAPSCRRRCASSGARQDLRASGSRGALVPRVARAGILSRRREAPREDFLDGHPASERHRVAAHGPCAQQHDPGHPLPLAPHARRDTCWVPGTDHAGIATQNVVERQLAAAGRIVGRSAARSSSSACGRGSASRARRSRASSRASACPATGSASASRWTRALTRRPRGVRPLYEEGLIYRDDTHHQLVPALPDRALRSRGRARGHGGQALAPRATRCDGRDEFHRRGDDAARDDAGRHRGRRASG